LEIYQNRIQEIVYKCNSISDILRACDIPTKGGNHKTIKRRLIEDNIEYDHIPKGNAANNGRIFEHRANTIPLSDILVSNSTYTNRGCLKKKLINNHILINECAICNMLPVWNNKPIVFILDHINGISNDHRIENLRLLCPNCNSQTITFAGRNRRGLV